MLKITKAGNVLEVKETIMSFVEDKVSFWYYDVEKWLSSLHGREGDTPTFPMSRSSIEWVEKHYLTKV